ncbi:hypothetical protein L596_016579 [Steinernema carpocapsae]|uniref:Uncharacterized protein n=1 Tax=Steinernema carpocapsae TaxID=34508 RepID=A0A4U5NIH1_STECR|nr:hypothetical protein L596_016579 [Steinernema carpocapsae]
MSRLQKNPSLSSQLTVPFLEELVIGIQDQIVVFCNSHNQLKKLEWAGPLTFSTWARIYRKWQYREVGEFTQKRHVSVKFRRGKLVGGKTLEVQKTTK